MGDIFSGLESMGLGKLTGLDLFKDEREAENKIEEKVNVVTKIDEKDILFDKSYECACCGKQFKEKTVKVGKNRMIAQDIDLRPRYDTGDSLKYGVVVCPICGYAALSRDFLHLSSNQSRLIKEKISANFTGLKYQEPTYSYDEAIARHKLALMNSVVKRGKISERAYLCLLLGWLTRAKAETLSEEERTEAALEALRADENAYLSKAVDGLKEAFSKETFPMAGLDENTAIYVVSSVNYEIGNYDESLRWASELLTNHTATDRIKDKARVIKEKIKEKTNG